MIHNKMKTYDYATLGAMDEYGQASDPYDVEGQIKMAIYLLNQTLTNNPLYSEASFVGLTNDKNINDSYIILDKDTQRLMKVEYVNSEGRLTQAFLKYYD